MGGQAAPSTEEDWGGRASMRVLQEMSAQPIGCSQLKLKFGRGTQRCRVIRDIWGAEGVWNIVFW